MAITVNGTEDGPLAVNDSATLDEDAPATAVDVLSNDGDIDGGPVFVASKTNGAHGDVAITGGGTGLTYLPDADYCGPDSFTYTLNGGSTATVSITVTCVDDPGTAVDDSATVAEDSGATEIDVGTNDNDIDGSLITSVTQPANGTVEITGGGESVSYTPDLDFCSPPADAFTYTVQGGSTGTVTVTVDCQNDPPVNSVPEAQSPDEDNNLAFSFGNGNLIEVSDIDAGAASLEVTLTATHGTLSLSGTAGLAFSAGDGTSDATMTFTGTAAAINSALAGLTYDPDNNYNGPASVGIVTDDQGNTGAGGAQSAADGIPITINAVDDDPEAVDDTKTVDEDDPPTTVDVLANDTDVDGGPMTIDAVTQPANGTVVNNGSDLTYEPDDDYCNDGSPTDDFTYTLNGGSVADVEVTVDCENDAPVNTVPGAQSTNEDTGLTFLNAFSVADVDAGAGDLEVTLTATHGTVTLASTTGLAFGAGDGTADATMTFSGTLAELNAALDDVTYDPDDNYNGPASLQMVTNDQGNTGAGGAQSDTDGVAITVEPVDDDPDAVDDTKTVDEDDPPTTVDVLANDTDVDGGPMTIDAVTQPANGTVVNNGSDLTYEPDDDYCNDGSPTDDFTYTLNGGSVADVEVTVDCQNDAPVNTVPGAQSTNEDTNLVLSSGNGNAISTSDGDAGSDDLEVTLTATQGTVTLASTTGLTFSAGDGTADVTTTFTGSATDINAALASLTYDPDDDYDGPASLQIVTDDQGNNGAGGAQTDTDSVAITVNAINDAPELDLDTGAGGTGSDATFEETDPHTGNGVQLAPIAEITDVDDTNIESASATLTNRLDGDAFESLAADAGATGITVGYTEETGLLELSGSEPIADYEQVLRSILYDNTDNPPDSADRLIDVVVNDGDGGSNTAVATVEVVPLI